MGGFEPAKALHQGGTTAPTARLLSPFMVPATDLCKAHGLGLAQSGRWVRLRVHEVIASQGAACAFAHKVVDGGMRALGHYVRCRCVRW